MSSAEHACFSLLDRGFAEHVSGEAFERGGAYDRMSESTGGGECTIWTRLRGRRQWREGVPDMATATKVRQMRTLIDQELGRYPQGDAPQNLFRALYEMTRLYGVGRKATFPCTPEAAHDLALEAVRRRYPDFEPQVIDADRLTASQFTFTRVATRSRQRERDRPRG